MATTMPILTFHAIDERPSITSFPPKLFERSMARLHDSGYRTPKLLELIECLRHGASFPDRSFVITFDDGYRTVYEHAFPVLQHHGITATVFLTVGTTKTEQLPSMEGRSMLSWSEIKEMHRWGIDFGAHTLTHPDLTRLRGDELEVEVAGGKAVIEDALGTPVTSFAYPFGRYDNWCRERVSHHFVCACSDRLGLLHSGSDLYAMERVDAYYLRTERLFEMMLTNLFPWYIRARGIPRRIRRALGPFTTCPG